MGMDLIPLKGGHETKQHYNWSGWRWIIQKLEEWDVDTSEFSGMNDGDPISEKTCKEVADAIEKHLGEFTGDELAWLKPQIERWRNCGGYEQC